ncbi:hypothetical protein GC163_04590 [bacterium]|nr:hypothetical protein [bacterium]
MGKQVSLRPGDPVIFCVSKFSTDPGPRAADVHPAEHGETYSYNVPKFWRVISLEDDGKLILGTRRGKRHRIDPGDPRLRRASFWERWLYANRFPAIEDSTSEPSREDRVVQNAAS